MRSKIIFYQRGNAFAEMAIVFPFFVIFTISLIEGGVCLVQTLILQNFCAGLARSLALSSLSTEENLRAAAQRDAARRFGAPVTAEVLLHDLPSLSQNPLRTVKAPQVIELHLTENLTSAAPFFAAIVGQQPLRSSVSSYHARILSRPEKN